MAVITIARQLGSGGARIAARVAEILGYEYVDHCLVEQIASITDSAPEEVEELDEKGEGRIAYFLKRLLVPELTPGGFPLLSPAYFPEFGLEFAYVAEREAGQETTYLDRGTYQLLITTLVHDFGQTGRVVIVGRASQLILADQEDALHVKIVAPLETRCKRLVEARDIDLKTRRDWWNSTTAGASSICAITTRPTGTTRCSTT